MVGDLQRRERGKKAKGGVTERTIDRLPYALPSWEGRILPDLALHVVHSSLASPPSELSGDKVLQVSASLCVGFA